MYYPENSVVDEIANAMQYKQQESELDRLMCKKINIMSDIAEIKTMLKELYDINRCHKVQ